MSKSKYACISVKTLAMRAQKIKESDYLELIKAKNLTAIFQYLRDRTYYGEFLKNLDPLNLHRTEIEVCLSDFKVLETEKLMHYLYGKDKSFFKMLLVQVEVESLRVLIRGIARNDDLESLRGLIVYSKKYTNVPFERLLRVKDWDKFKELLIDTDYYRVLEIFKEVSIEQDLVMIEKSLDRYYYDSLKKRLLELDKKINRDLINAQQRNFDLLNLVWIYRGIKFYKLSREALIAYSLRGGLEINERRLSNLVDAKNTEEIKEQLINSDYAFLFNHTKTIDLYMERRMKRYLYYMYLKLFSEGSNSLGRAFAYSQLLDFEIADITSIIESKRYRMKPAEIKYYLIRSID